MTVVYQNSTIFQVWGIEGHAAGFVGVNDAHHGVGTHPGS